MINPNNQANGQLDAAAKLFQQSVDITPFHAYQLIEVWLSEGVRAVVYRSLLRRVECIENSRTGYSTFPYDTGVHLIGVDMSLDSKKICLRGSLISFLFHAP